jgi:hypothetical protein
MITTSFNITAPEAAYLKLAIKHGWHEVMVTSEEVTEEGSVTVTTTATGLDSNNDTFITYIQRYVQEQVISNWLGQEILFFRRFMINDLEDMKKQVEATALQDAYSMVSQVPVTITNN